jgi:DNA-binding NtrC family response regulator
VQDIAAGSFREDLYYRLNVVPIHIPPLRERREDIPLLVEHFLAKFNDRLKKQIDSVSADAISRLVSYHWPGNIRELENLVQREFLLADGPRISVGAPPTALAPAVEPGPPLNYRQAKRRAIREFESSFLAHLIGQANGNISAAARISGTERRHLGRLLKKHNL